MKTHTQGDRPVHWAPGKSEPLTAAQETAPVRRLGFGPCPARGRIPGPGDTSAGLRGPHEPTE